jgi:hypothetical protein
LAIGALKISELNSSGPDERPVPRGKISPAQEGTGLKVGFNHVDPKAGAEAPDQELPMKYGCER